MENNETRRWQVEAEEKISQAFAAEGGQIVPVNACVGSGKTNVAAFAFGKFIMENKDSKTLQVFVCPRIRLCSQQSNEIAEYLKSKFGLEAGRDFQMYRRDCEYGDFNVKELPADPHVVVVVCDESLWGIDKNADDPEVRWHNWIGFFRRCDHQSRKFGCIAFDEAHNYASNVEKIYGKGKSLHKRFKMVMLMSGTPAAYQIELSREWPQNVCSCAPKEAIDNGWICKPTLNLVNCGDADWPNAVKAVYEKELADWEASSKVFRPTILVNCSSIDDIYHLRETPWFKERVGKEFHFISIHSSKSMTLDDGSVADVTAEVDGKPVEAGEAYAKIEKIDDYGQPNASCDGLPVLVAQVQMIGEGINVKSFNAVITASNSDKTAMQQIGRAIRNFKVVRDQAETILVKEFRPKATARVIETTVKKPRLFGLLHKTEVVKETVFDVVDEEVMVPTTEMVRRTFSKVKEGKANVYVIYDNRDAVERLIWNLSNYDLTDKCFDWGKKIDMMHGSTPEVLAESNANKFVANRWNPISEKSPEIVEIVAGMNHRILEAQVDGLFARGTDVDGNGIDDADDWLECCKYVNSKGMARLFTHRKGDAKPDDLLESMKEQLRKFLSIKIHAEAFKKNPRAALDCAFFDDKLGEFWDKHMTAKAKAALVEGI